MNRRISLAGLLAIALAAPLQALAQACSLSLSPTDIDLGQFNRTTVQLESGELPLPPRRLSLSVLCETEQDLTLAYRASPFSNQGYALGSQGAYRLSVLQASVDDQPVQWGQVAAAVPPAATRTGAAALEGDRSLQPLRGGRAVRGKHLQAQIELQATLAPTVLAASDAHELSASGSFDIVGQQKPLLVRAGFAPAACRPSLGGNANVNFGRIGMADLRRESVTTFSRQTVLEVDCDAPTRFAIRALDNRAGSVSDQLLAAAPTLFGIGRTADGQALGGFTARLGAGIGRDGSSAYPLLGDASAQTWRPHPDGWLRSDGQPTALGRQATPGAWSGLSLPLTVELHLAPARGLDVRQETPIDGSATLEIIYL
ncbi:DUF1120 domain-containing protein [Pseudomonas sp. CFBP 8770]|uniref:DUF1120 domain-containing protein n=1 Tax=unclassified Pseudomonas TaxID=196821 RepID=UPI00177DA81F|nr:MULTISPECIES: DUF1120 domain-containing protein [unclassified Pseudomonas]MBD8474168.1 DUF1120 domain-containing protein [Pseudomonas sp. CFBP 8773]MBD8647298.1 DUF1120 domain-containing protein [Pseudomonas sp. CFBP 8770]